MTQRPIKFRAWDKTKMTWLSPYLFKLWSDGRVCVSTPDGNKMNDEIRDDIELVEFTGLLDRNGKEIWEGDIVWDTEYPKEDWAIYEVDFDRGYFGMTDQKYKNKQVGIWNVHQRCEVIGNVYETPELL